MEITFSFERETKGTKRYAEQSDEPVIGTLYVKKSVAANLPDTFTLTLPVATSASKKLSSVK